MASFEALSPYDFEVLVQDLVGAERGIRLESFASGRDSGIDLRHLGEGGGSKGALIVQCKHYEKTGYSGLLSHMKKELTKAAALKARIYILATTVALTPARKDELKAILASVAPEVSVLGKEDLEALLRAYPEVEKTHYKLWLTSTAILDKVMNNAILMRSQGMLEELNEKAAIFVKHKGVEAAEQILHDARVIIISGAPGVGKSTLADILLMTLVGDDYEPVIIGNGIEDAEQMYRISTKQVFYYDDFLGRTSVAEKFRSNEDNRLTSFMRRIHKSQNKYLIMTTRQHIIEQARHIYDRLDDPSVDLSRYVLDLTVYTRNERAHIVYNHIFFSSLPLEHREKIVQSEVYLELIDSANFNPRLVELALNLAILQKISVADIASFLASAFDNPRTLWQHVMENQLTLAQNGSLPIWHSTFGRWIGQLRHLENRYYAANFGTDARRTLEEELRTLEGVTVKISDGQHGIIVQLSNPGVIDGVKEFILNQSSVFETLLPTLTTWQQASGLWNNAFEKVGNTFWRGTYGKSATGQRHYLLSPVSVEEAKRPGLVALIRRNLDLFIEVLATCACDNSPRGSYYHSDEIEGRLATLLELLPPLTSGPVDKALAPLVKRIRLRWAESRGDKRATVDLLAVLEKTKLVKETEDIIADGRSYLEKASNYDPNDYLALHMLATETVQLDQSRFAYPNAEDVEQAFIDYVETKIVDFMNEDLSQVRGELEELESVANNMNVDVYDEFREMWRKVEDAEKASDAEDYDRTDLSKTSGTEMEEGDDFPNNLFESLV